MNTKNNEKYRISNAFYEGLFFFDSIKNMPVNYLDPKKIELGRIWAEVGNYLRKSVNEVSSIGNKKTSQ